MKALLWVLAIGALYSCNVATGKNERGIAAEATAGTPDNGQLPYPQFLKRVAAERHRLAGKPGTAAPYLFSILNNDIPAYWTGTPWDFNGTTRVPGEGAIACGYFITNVLADLGFGINRVKLAQQASSVMINSLTVNVKRMAGIAALKKYLEQQKPGSVFIVGLDFHTGWIIKTAEGCYFLHANYIDRQGVVKEPIEGSAALSASKSFMIGNLTANTALLAQWVKS